MLALIKHILSVAFVLGLVANVIRLIDGKLSDSTKKRINSWFDDKTLRVDALDVESLYKFFRMDAWRTPTVVSLLSVPVLYYIFPKHNDSYGPFLLYVMLLVIATFMLYHILRTAFRAPSIREAFERYRESVFITLIVVICFVCSSVLLGAVKTRSVDAAQMMRDIYDNRIPMIYALVYPLAIIPLLLLYLLRLPILAFSKLLWWIATYPKGPWGGIMALSTFVLGIIRLFL